MKTVLVTGASGFIGKNLCALLERDKDIHILKFTRSNSYDDLETYVSQADFIVHLAGVNRPEKDSEFDVHNLGLTEKILEYIEKTSSNTSLLFSSSTQAELDNAYGLINR